MKFTQALCTLLIPTLVSAIPNLKRQVAPSNNVTLPATVTTTTTTTQTVTVTVTAYPAVTFLGSYVVTVVNAVDLGDGTTYYSAYPTTTSGPMVVSNGAAVAASPTVTQTASAVTDTGAALPSGQYYSTVIVPSNGISITITIIVIPFSFDDSYLSDSDGANTDSANTGAGGNVGAGSIATSTPAIYSNSSMTSTTPAASSTSSVAGGVNLGPAVTASSSAASTTPAADATTTTPAATSATTAATCGTSTAVAGTQAKAVGSLGTTPLTNQQAFIDAMLTAHNTYRARHQNTPAMTWNCDLVPTALNNANTNAAGRTFLHTKDMGISDPYGENIGEQYGYNNPSYLLEQMYAEISKYDYGNPGYSDAAGHFTQMVWVASTELGCAYVEADDANGTYYLACEYNQPGNALGTANFEANVQPLITNPPAAATYPTTIN